MRALANAFPSEAALEQATEEDFVKINKIGKPLATKLYKVMSGQAVVDGVNWLRLTIDAGTPAAPLRGDLRRVVGWRQRGLLAGPHHRCKTSKLPDAASPLPG